MIIAHDLGTTANKATLVSSAGVVVASLSAPYGANFASDGLAEQNPHDWWRAMCRATSELLERTGIPAAKIAAVSFSGQMMGVVPMDAGGEVVHPAIIWADTRARIQSDELTRRIGMERAYAITGHRLNPTYSLAKIMWLRDNKPEVFTRIATTLQAKDYLVYRLTGVLVTDRSDASGTNAYDQRTGSWSNELIEAAELDRKIFPEILESATVVGKIRAEVAEEAGLCAGTPVVLGGGDGPMAALGAGIIDSDSGAYAYLGSSSWVSVSADTPLHDPLMRSMTFNHVVPGRFVPTATMQTGGAALQWITDILSPKDKDRYQELLLQAAKVQAADEGLYFLPHLLGERSPYWNPNARAAFVGMHFDHGRAHLVRAVLEGIAFNLYTGLRAFTDSGHPITQIDAIGGAAHAGLLLQIFANTWGASVAVRNLVDEAGALGAAVVAGVAVGVFSDFDIVQSFSKREHIYQTDPAIHGRIAWQYQEFLDAYSRIEPWFDLMRKRRSE